MEGKWGDKSGYLEFYLRECGQNSAWHPAGSLVPILWELRAEWSGSPPCNDVCEAFIPHSSEDASYCIFVISKLRKWAQRGSNKLTHLVAKSDSNLVFQIPQNACRVQSQPHRTCRPRRAEDGDLVRGPGS